MKRGNEGALTVNAGTVPGRPCKVNAKDMRCALLRLVQTAATRRSHNSGRRTQTTKVFNFAVFTFVGTDQWCNSCKALDNQLYNWWAHTVLCCSLVCTVYTSQLTQHNITSIKYELKKTSLGKLNIFMHSVRLVVQLTICSLPIQWCMNKVQYYFYILFILS